MVSTGDSRPMWMNMTPPAPPNPLADAVRELAEAIRGLATELTAPRSQYLHVIDDGDLEPGLDEHA